MNNCQAFSLPRWRLLIAVLALVGVCAAPARAASGAAQGEQTTFGPKVVATIKPLHALIAGVMAGAGQPTLLLRGTATPHQVALKPSDLRSLHQAQVIFQASPALELFLEKTTKSLPKSVRVVALLHSPGIVRHDARAAGAFSGEAASHHGHHHGHHNDRNIDPHFWLDPQNAKAAAQHIASVLGEIDPANRRRFQDNANAMAIKLDALTASLKTRLRPYMGKPYIVFHDAYQYWEHRFGLTPAGALSLGPEQQPGARRIAKLRQTVREHKVSCVFSEPQFEPRLIRTLTEDTAASTGVLDPLGAHLTPGSDLYTTLLKKLADDFIACMGKSGGLK